MARYSAEEYDNDICPRCQTNLVTQDDRCTSCGYNLIGVRFYSPDYFVWLSLLLTAMVPIYLSASNWGKIGKKKTKWLWLGGGIAFFIVLFTAFYYLPDSKHINDVLIGSIVNIPIALYLRAKQIPVYGVAIQLGASRASLFKGSLVGFFFLIIAIAVPATTFMMKYYSELDHGIELFENSQYGAAIMVFNEILRDDPKDEDALVYSALCNYNMEHWDESQEILVNYLKINTNNPVVYALLSKIHSIKGDMKEAEKMALQARILDPEIFDKLFDDSSAPDDSTGP